LDSNIKKIILFNSKLKRLPKIHIFWCKPIDHREQVKLNWEIPMKNQLNFQNKMNSKFFKTIKIKLKALNA
jgi:hypothetical protein